MLDPTSPNGDTASNSAASHASGYPSPGTSTSELTYPTTVSRPHSRSLRDRKELYRRATPSLGDDGLQFRVSSFPPRRLIQASLTMQQPTSLVVLNKRRRRKHREDDEGDESAVSAWLATRLLGGLRGDPFNVFPIEPRDCVPQAVDNCTFFTRSYG